MLYRSICSVILIFGLVLTACTSKEELNENFVQAARTGDDQKVKALLKKGADIEALDQKFGATALMWAAHEGYPDIVRFLLDKGATIDSQQHLGCTAFWYSAQQGKLEAVKVLIDHGADISIADHDGKTPLEIATELGHVGIVEMIRNVSTTE